MSILNYTQRTMCEYHSIFPTVASVLDHLLFTIGTGHSVDKDTGALFLGQYTGTKLFLHEYPAMTEKSWQQLILHCQQRELAQGTACRHPDWEDIRNQCEQYKPVILQESAFDEESLYADLVQLRTLSLVNWVRPYPLSTEFSNIYKITKHSPAWLIAICSNTCKAWVRFLTEEIAAGRVARPAADGRHYADMEYTIKHRDMLAARAEYFESCI